MSESPAGNLLLSNPTRKGVVLHLSIAMNFVKLRSSYSIYLSFLRLPGFQDYFSGTNSL